MGKKSASIGRELPEDLVQHPSWKGHQQHVFGHVPLIFRQIHRIHAHEQKYEIRHNNIAPENEQEMTDNELSPTNPWQKWEPRDKPDWKKEQNEQAPQPYQHLHPHKQWKVISLQALVSLASNCFSLPIQVRLFLCSLIRWKLTANVKKHVD